MRNILRSAVDFAPDYLKQLLDFIGLHGFRIVAAEQVDIDEKQASSNARQQSVSTAGGVS